MKPRFLGLEEIFALQAEQIELYAGSTGVRDVGMVESAAATPEASFDGTYLHGTLPEMAAAYWYHFVQNHAFVDGNKRIGVAAMLMFLYLNDLDLACDEDELVALTVGIASGNATKAEVAVFLVARVAPMGRGERP